MNRAELRTQTFRALNEDPDDPVFWDREEIHQSLFEAMEVLAEEAPSLKRTYYVARRAGTYIYHLEGMGHNIQTPYRIWLPDMKRNLEAWSMTDLDRQHEAWVRVSGTPWVWAPLDWRQFVIWPIPAAAGGTMEVNCYVWPDELFDDHDEPEFHQTDHHSLVYYGEMEGYLKQWDVPRALDMLRKFSQGWRDAQARAGIRQMQGQFGVRQAARREPTSDSGRRY